MENRVAFPTAMGWLLLTWEQDALTRLHLCGEPPVADSTAPRVPPWVQAVRESLTAFLAGEGSWHRFREVPLALRRVPPFQRRVLERLRETIPGQTLTYGQLAVLAGSPGAARAVGTAVARNPLPIVIPCHRVVAANGPGGFSLFGSLVSKARLLALEGVVL